MPGFFISYRRDDSAGHAGRLHDRLIEHFGRENIFIDVDTIGLGVDFLEAIRDAIRDTNGLIAVIGREWVGATNDSGGRRLDDPQDFVRLEIATALELGVRVIPVLVQGAPQLRAGDLPDDLQHLASLNALEVSDTRFHTDVDRLIESLGDISLAQASQLAISTARNTPGEYGAEFSGVSMSFEVAETGETDDQYLVTLSFQPEGRGRGAPGREQFFIEKGGHVDRRHVISLPGRAGRQRNPLVLAVIALLVTAGAVAGIVAVTGGGDDNPLPAASAPSLTPETPASRSPTATLAVSPVATANLISETLSVVLEPSQIAMEAGSTIDLTAIISGDSGSRLIDPEIHWLALPAAGSISAEGVFTAGTKAGKFSGAIQLTVEQGASTGSATFDVTIEPGPLDRVEVLPAGVVLSRGESVQFSLVGSDSYGNRITGLEVSWEGGKGLSIDGTGLVTTGPLVPGQPLPGLVGWWPGDGNAEDVFAGQNGIASPGVVYSSGVFGQAFRFDGDDDFVAIEDFDASGLRGDMTVHLWAKRATLGGPAVMVVKGAGVVANIDVPTTFVLKFGSERSPGRDGNYLWGGFEHSNGSDVFLVGPEITDSLVHHYAYVRAGNSHKLYLDGVNVASDSFVGLPGSTSGLALVIGAGPTHGPNRQPFGGMIDEVQIFDRALTEAEIEEIFMAANPDGRYRVTVAAKYKGVERTASVEVVIQN